MNHPPTGDYTIRSLLAPAIPRILSLTLAGCAAVPNHSSDVRTFYCDEGKVFRLSEKAKQDQAILFLAGEKFSLSRLQEGSGRSYASANYLVGLDAHDTHLEYKGIRVMENCSTEGNPEVHIIALRGNLPQIEL